MRVTKFTHACVRLAGEQVLVIDPGAFSEREALAGADAVLITHEHPDHVDVDALVEAGRARSALTVYAHPSLTSMLSALGPALTPVEAGQSFTAAGFEVRAYGGRHAVIHPDIPGVANLAYLVSAGGMSVYHPGDSFEVPPDARVDTLFVPVSAPWLKISEAVDFVRAVQPRRAFALHDALLSEIGSQLTTRLMSNLSGSDYARLTPGTNAD